MINWQPRSTFDENQMEKSERILVYTPDYPDGDPMQIRIIDAQFFKLCKDATQWSVLNTPD